MAVYDINGNPVVSEGSLLGVSDLAIYDDGTASQRQGILTYENHRLYPINYGAQRPLQKKIYNGGLLLALGDSYTSMGSTNFSAFAQAHGLVCDNLGVGSSTIAGDDGGNVGFRPFWKRLDTEIASFPKTISGTTYQLADVKLVTFMGGANDWWTVTETIDRLGDPTSTDKAQLYGACKYIFEKLYTTFPNADIIVVLQPSNVASDTSNYAMWLKEGIVRNCAEMYSLPTCDCRFDWYSPVNPSDKAKYWQSDNLHLSNDGYTELFKKLELTLNSLQFYRGN